MDSHENALTPDEKESVKRLRKAGNETFLDLVDSKVFPPPRKYVLATHNKSRRSEWEENYKK